MKAKTIEVVFYRTESGVEPVRDWLKKCPRADRRIVGEDLKTAELGWPIGMPLARKLTNGIWEIRSSLSRGRIARVLFIVKEQRMILLHGFVKKDRKTRRQDLSLAQKRKRQIDKAQVQEYGEAKPTFRKQSR
jgi:phage-related protein